MIDDIVRSFPASIIRDEMFHKIDFSRPIEQFAESREIYMAFGYKISKFLIK